MTETKLNPDTITTDFEAGLIQACKEHFPEVHLIGCLFYFKQALRRKMQKLRIKLEEISRAMNEKHFNVLTVTAKKDISKKIKKIRKEVNKTEKKKWNKFYQYFNKIWMKDDMFDIWNVSNTLSKNVDIQNRTNNALENFNKQLNGEFGFAHPNIFNFINTIKRISIEKFRELNDRRK